MSVEEEELVYSFTTDPAWLSDALQFVGDGLLLNFSKLSEISEGRNLPEKFTIAMELSEHNQDEDEYIPTYSSPMASARAVEANQESLHNAIQAASNISSKAPSEFPAEETSSRSKDNGRIEETDVKYNGIDLAAFKSPKDVAGVSSKSADKTKEDENLDKLIKTKTTDDKTNVEDGSEGSQHLIKSNEAVESPTTLKPVKRTESVLQREIRLQQEREDEVLKERERAMRQLRLHRLTEESKQQTDHLKQSQQTLLASIHKDSGTNKAVAADSKEDSDEISALVAKTDTEVKGVTSPRTETLEYIQQDIKDQLRQQSQLRRSSALSKSDYYKYYKSALNAT